MIALIVILVVATGYALIRAKHDSFISHGPWKPWAFVEGVYSSLVVVALTWQAFGLIWYAMAPLAMVFAFTFWLVFDCVQGYIRTGNILYIGDKGFDARVKKVVGGIPIMYPIGKLIWLIIFSGSYISLY